MEGEQHHSRIYVCARVRPIISEDFKLGTVTRSSPEICVHLKHDGQTIKMTKDVYDVKMFRVDHTFDAVANQQEVYESSFKRIVTDALNGYNGTGMVYGQTGSGKSYTMFGVDNDPGLVHLAINDVFTAVRKHLSNGLVANVFLSFYQLYLEQAFDLLVSPTTGKFECTPLAVREDAEKGAFVENLRYIYVDDEPSTIDVLKQGLKNRKVQSTQFNMNSSRSHAIFQMYLDFEETGECVVTADHESKYADCTSNCDDGANKKFSVRRRVLTFVDLAGSERVQTHHQAKSKTQFKESVTINKSISALGNCIQALANSSSTNSEQVEEMNGYFPHNIGNQQKRNLHIPFRDSKLTRLLAEPLGGNSKTCIIVNIGPCYYNYEETKSTLKFARRAMTVKKSVKKSEIEQLQVEDVQIEEPPEASPSPPKVGIGAKHVPNVKVSRIVVRTSPEERLRQSSGSSYLFDGQASYEGFRDKFESVRSQLQFHSITASSSSHFAVEGGGDGGGGDGEDEEKGSGESNTYMLHLPAGSEFDDYGSVVDDGAVGTDGITLKPAVRLNLGDFLKACQVNSSSLLRSISFSAANGSSTRENSAVNGTPSRNKNSRTVSTPMQPEGYVVDDFLHESDTHFHSAALSLESTLTPIVDGRSEFSPYVNESFSTANMSLGLSPAPAPASSKTEPVEEAVVEVTEENVVTPVAPDITLPSSHNRHKLSARRDYEVEDSPQMASPAGVTTNGNAKTKVKESPPATEPAATEIPVVQETAPAAAAPRTHRRFVWERGSGEPYYNTVEITPLLNRHTRRTSSVAAVAPVSTGMHTTTHYFPDDPNPLHVHSPISLRSSGGASAKKPRKVAQYLKCTALAVEGASDSPAATPSTDTERHPTTGSGTDNGHAAASTAPEKHMQTPRKAMSKETASPHKAVLAITTVRDETTTTPRSEVPKPTPSPSPVRLPTARGTFAKSPLGRATAGPYTFHQANPAPAYSSRAQQVSRVVESPPKRAVSWNDHHSQGQGRTKNSKVTAGDGRPVSSSPAVATHQKAVPVKLASTVVPFGNGGITGPHTDPPAPSDIDTLLGRKAAPSTTATATSTETAGGTDTMTMAEESRDMQQSQEWVALVKELREELQRKEEEITTLRSFILNN